MLLIRPVNFTDLQQLEQLAVLSSGRMTTLPANRDHLSELINTTEQSLKKPVQQHAQESYHFVLEDTQQGRIVGVSGIDAAVGIRTPFYSYRMDEVVHASRELQIHNRIPALHLCQDYTGSARLCTLFLDSAYRSHANLNLLSRARLLFIAQQPQRFAHRLIAELQGVADEHNRSPFWECLGRHFFNMDFTKANYLTGINSKGFVADLMPHYPVYVPLLSAAAQAAIGQPRPDLAPVQQLLHHEGLRHAGYVDIFDAGPTLHASTATLHSVAHSQLAKITVGTGTPATATPVLVSNIHTQTFRCLLADLDPANPTLTAASAEQLQVSSGDPVRLIPLAYPTSPTGATQP